VYLLVSELNNAKMTARNFNNCSEWLSMTAYFIDSGLEHGNFLNSDISQGSVVTQLRCGGIINKGFVANILVNLSMKAF